MSLQPLPLPLFPYYQARSPFCATLCSEFSQRVTDTVEQQAIPLLNFEFFIEPLCIELYQDRATDPAAAVPGEPGVSVLCLIALVICVLLPVLKDASAVLTSDPGVTSVPRIDSATGASSAKKRKLLVSAKVGMNGWLIRPYFLCCDSGIVSQAFKWIILIYLDHIVVVVIQTVFTWVGNS